TDLGQLRIVGRHRPEVAVVAPVHCEDEVVLLKIARPYLTSRMTEGIAVAGGCLAHAGVSVLSDVVAVSSRGFEKELEPDAVLLDNLRENRVGKRASADVPCANEKNFVSIEFHTILTTGPRIGSEPVSGPGC